MGLLDDTAIFTAIVDQGGFGRAAKYLNLSNGLISRRIAQLEATLGASLIKRTTRQFTLTPEGEVFWQHAKRIQQELDSAVTFIQSAVERPGGAISISAPVYFGRHYLAPVVFRFLREFEGITVNLMLENRMVDPVRENIDIVIRGSGYLNPHPMEDSTLHARLLANEKICLYASPAYLQAHGEPKNPAELPGHNIINHSNNNSMNEHARWSYSCGDKEESVMLVPKFNCNDIETSLHACSSGYGIGRYTDLNVRRCLGEKALQIVLGEYDWGEYKLYAVYPHQQNLPKRSRLLLEFIGIHMKNW